MKKNNKKSILTVKQKLIIVAIALLVFVTILAIALNPTGVKKQTSPGQTINSLEGELKSIEDVIKHYECIYYNAEDSKEDGYDIDVYVGFKYNLYEGDESKESFFKDIYEKVAIVTQFKSFRLIDNTKNITVSVRCNNGKISEVFINGVKDYYKLEDSKRSRENALIVDEIKVNVDSDVLKNLIEASWQTNQVDLGTKESVCNKYDIYFDEGYEVRTIQGRVFNIVFTKKYNKPVIEGFKPGSNIEKVKANLGESYTQFDFAGYRTKDFYIYFSEDEISIYPNRKIDYKGFEDLVQELNNKKNMNEFLDKLTDLWPDYDKYEYDSNYVEIWYTLKGVKIQYNSTNPQGIQIYENYKGDLKDNKEELANVYYKLDQNLLIEKEELRKMTLTLCDNGEIETDPIHYSNKFCFRPGSSFQSHMVLSLDDQYPNTDIDIMGNIDSYVWCDDTHLLFSIRYQGLYLFDAAKRELSELLKDENKEFEIKGYDRNQNLLEYDEEKVRINF